MRCDQTLKGKKKKKNIEPPDRHPVVVRVGLVFPTHGAPGLSGQVFSVWKSFSHFLVQKRNPTPNKAPKHVIGASELSGVFGFFFSFGCFAYSLPTIYALMYGRCRLCI